MLEFAAIGPVWVRCKQCCWSRRVWKELFHEQGWCQRHIRLSFLCQLEKSGSRTNSREVGKEKGILHLQTASPEQICVATSLLVQTALASQGEFGISLRYEQVQLLSNMMHFALNCSPSSPFPSPPLNPILFHPISTTL